MLLYCHHDQNNYESSPGSFDECRLSAKWPPTIRPCQRTLAKSADKWLLPSTSTIAICYYYCPKADSHFTIPQSVEGWVELGTAVRVRSPCPRQHIAVVVILNNCPWPHIPQSGMLPPNHWHAETDGCEQLAQGCYLTVQWLRIELATMELRVQHSTTEPPKCLNVAEQLPAWAGVQSWIWLEKQYDHH